MTFGSCDLQEFRRPLCDLFKTLCPEFVDHRWEYLYDALAWAVPREKALQFLKLHDFSSPAAKEDENQHQLSAKHLELLQELGHENKRSCRFWAIAGLCRILAHWGHNVTGYLHGCLCHQGKVAQEPSKKKRKKDPEHLRRLEEEAARQKCPMAGRMGVALACGYHKRAIQDLQGATIPSHVQQAVHKLNSIDDARAGDVLMDRYRTAISRLTFRMGQAFGHWDDLPWALLIVMRPYVDTFTTAEEAHVCLQQSKQAAKLLVRKYDLSPNQASLGLISYRFLSEKGPFRAHLMEWASTTCPMFQPLFWELTGYATGLVVMQRLESRHSLLKRHLAWRHKQLPATLSATLRRAENGDLKSPHFQFLLPELLTSIGELDPGEFSCKTDFLERISRGSALALHDSLQEERKQKETFQEQLAMVAGQRQGNASSELILVREHLKAALEKGKCYSVKGYHDKNAWSTFRLLNLNPGQNSYLQRTCYLSNDES